MTLRYAAIAAGLLLASCAPVVLPSPSPPAPASATAGQACVEMRGLIDELARQSDRITASKGDTAVVLEAVLAIRTVAAKVSQPPADAPASVRGTAVILQAVAETADQATRDPAALERLASAVAAAVQARSELPCP